MSGERPSWLAVALAAAAGFFAGVLLVAILGGAKGTTQTQTKIAIHTRTSTVTKTQTQTKTVTAPAEDTVPDVVGATLDDAKSTLEDAGYDVEVQDSTLFGIVDPENFTVTDQRPKAGGKPPPDGKITLTVERS